jgi:aspartyl protease family protein
MKLALAVTIGIGTTIGVMLPTTPPAPSAARPPAATATPTVVKEDPPSDTVLERSAGGHFYAVAEVNGEPIRFLVDTGASTIALSEEDAMRAHISFDPATYEPVGHGASGVVHGQRVTVDRIVLDGKAGEGLSGIVLPDASVSLLGQNYLRRLNVQIAGDTMTLR